MGLFGKSTDEKNRIANFNEMSASIQRAISEDKLGYYFFFKAGIIRAENPQFDKWGELKNIGAGDLSFDFVNKDGNIIIAKLSDEPGIYHAKIKMIENGCVKIQDKDGKVKAVKVEGANKYYEEIERIFNYTANYGVDFATKRFQQALVAGCKGKPVEFKLDSVYGQYMSGQLDKFIDRINKAEPMATQTKMDFTAMELKDAGFNVDAKTGQIDFLEIDKQKNKEETNDKKQSVEW